MLFQLSILRSLSRILDNPASRQPKFADLYATCFYVSRRFFSLAKTNPCLFVEVLVWKKAHECEDILTGYSSRTQRPSGRGGLGGGEPEQQRPARGEAGFQEQAAVERGVHGGAQARAAARIAARMRL